RSRLRERRASRTRYGPPSSSGSPTCSGFQEDRLHPFRLPPDVLRRRGLAPPPVWAGEVPPPPQRPPPPPPPPPGPPGRPPAARPSAGARGRRARGATPPAGPRAAGATTDRPDAIPSSVARPNGSVRLGWQRTSLPAIQVGTASWPTRPTSSIPARPSSAPRS